MFARPWVGVGVADDVAAPGSYLATTAGTVPVLVVRDDDGGLRAFLNVCRHRGSATRRAAAAPARALSCPYHAWVYRLDGTLARAGGVGEPEGSTPTTTGCSRSAVTTFARSVLVNLDPAAAPFDPGPLGAAPRSVPTRRARAR